MRAGEGSISARQAAMQAWTKGQRASCAAQKQCLSIGNERWLKTVGENGVQWLKTVGKIKFVHVNCLY